MGRSGRGQGGNMGKSKKARLLEWIKDIGEASSAEIENYAYTAFDMLPSNARRRCREWAERENEGLNILKRFKKPGSALVHYKYLGLRIPKKPKPEPEIFTKQETLSLGV